MYNQRRKKISLFSSLFSLHFFLSLMDKHRSNKRAWAFSCVSFMHEVAQPPSILSTSLVCAKNVLIPEGEKKYGDMEKRWEIEKKVFFRWSIAHTHKPIHIYKPAETEERKEVIKKTLLVNWIGIHNNIPLPHHHDQTKQNCSLESGNGEWGTRRKLEKMPWNRVKCSVEQKIKMHYFPCTHGHTRMEPCSSSWWATWSLGCTNTTRKIYIFMVLIMKQKNIYGYCIQ